MLQIKQKVRQSYIRAHSLSDLEIRIEKIFQIKEYGNKF